MTVGSPAWDSRKNALHKGVSEGGDGREAGTVDAKDMLGSLWASVAEVKVLLGARRSAASEVVLFEELGLTGSDIVRAEGRNMPASWSAARRCADSSGCVDMAGLSLAVRLLESKGNKAREAKAVNSYSKRDRHRQPQERMSGNQ